MLIHVTGAAPPNLFSYAMVGMILQNIVRHLCVRKPGHSLGNRLSIPIPLMTNGFTHRYHLGESTLIFRDFRCDFNILFHFSMKFLRLNKNNSPRWDVLRRHIWGYHDYLLMSHKKNTRLKRVNAHSYMKIQRLFPNPRHRKGGNI